MDSKKLSELDPKLKEIYDRVMGTSSQPTPQSSTPPKPPISNPTNQATTVPSPNFPPPPPSNTTPVSPDASSTVTIGKQQSKAKISPLVWIVGIFFVIYALIWIKVFNLKLPFLPK